MWHIYFNRPIKTKRSKNLCCPNPPSTTTTHHRKPRWCWIKMNFVSAFANCHRLIPIHLKYLHRWRPTPFASPWLHWCHILLPTLQINWIKSIPCITYPLAAITEKKKVGFFVGFAFFIFVAENFWHLSTPACMQQQVPVKSTLWGDLDYSIRVKFGCNWMSSITYCNEHMSVWNLEFNWFGHRPMQPRRVLI